MQVMDVHKCHGIFGVNLQNRSRDSIVYVRVCMNECIIVDSIYFDDND